MLIYNSHNESELLRSVSQGDELAFQHLISVYSQRVFFHALTFVKSPAVAEELVQDIFLRIWQKRQKLLDVENWDKYLFTVTKNFLINAMARIADIAASAEVPEYGNDLRPDKQHENKEMLELLTKAINQLPEQKRAVFQLIHLDGLSQSEVSQQLGIATRTVRWNLVSAMNEIRDFLRRHAINTGYLLFFTLSLKLF